MYETCTVCDRTFYARDYPPRLCPICEEELLRREGPGNLLLSQKKHSERLVPRI